MNIYILGIYAKECKHVEQRLLKILKRLGLNMPIIINDDIDVLLLYGLSKSPAILIENEIIENKHLKDENYLETKIMEHVIKDDKNQRLA